MKKIYYDSRQQPHEKQEGDPVIWRPSAYGILENVHGEWLMVEPTWISRLDFPGGGVEVEERVIDGLAREFYEETGYRVEVDPAPLFIGENDFYYGTAGPFCHALIMIFRVRLKSEKRDAEVVNSFEDGEEIADMRWVHPTTLTSDTVQPPVRLFLEHINQVKKS